MRRLLATATLIGLALSAPLVQADMEEKLIKLDREWGEATKPGQLKDLLTEKYIGLTEDGVVNRQKLMDELEKEGPSDEPYVSGGYTVQLIDDKVAVMVHTAGSGDESYRSMHVWRKHDGVWKVAASASVEADD